MKQWCCIVAALGSLYLVSISHAADVSPGMPLNDASRSLWYLIDATGNKTIQDIIEYPDAFEHNNRPSFNVGLTRNPVWLRLTLTNEALESGVWVIALNKALFNELEVFEVAADSATRIFDYSNSEQRVDALTRFGTTAFKARLNGQETKTWYLRFVTGNTSLALKVRPIETHMRAERFRLLFALALALIVSALVVFATFPLAFIERRIFLLYAGVQLTGLMLCAHLGGLTTAYLWPEDPYPFRNVGSQLAILYNTLLLQFARVFFELKRRVMRIDWIFRVAVYAGLLTLVATTVATFYPISRVTITVPALIVAVTAAIGLPVVAIVGTVAWNRSFWPMLIAWMLLASFSISIVLVVAGVLSSLPMGNYFYMAVVVVEGLCMAAALVLRVRQIQRSRDEVEARLAVSNEQQALVAQRMLAIAQQKASALADVEAKGQLLTSTGHDARQIVAALRAYAFGLKHDSVDRFKAAVDVDQLAQDLDHLLTAAIGGAEAGGIEDAIIALSDVALNDLFETVRLIHEPEARRRSLSLRLRAGGYEVTTDRVLLLRIITNLVSNAVKFTESGGVLVAARRVSGRTAIEVWDTGKGMSSLQIKAVMHAGGHRFSPGQEGLGVGLQGVMLLAQRLGAFIEVTSRPGVGTRFRLTLPETHGLAVEHARFYDDDLHELVSAEPAVMPRTGEAEAVPDLFVVAQDHGGPDSGLGLIARLREQYPDSHFVVTTWDRSAQARLKFADFCDGILYKPPTVRSVRYLLY